VEENPKQRIGRAKDGSWECRAEQGLEEEQYVRTKKCVTREGDHGFHCIVQCITRLTRDEIRDTDPSRISVQKTRDSRLYQGVGMGGKRNNMRATRQSYHVPRAAKHAVTTPLISSPCFFFWRNVMTSGTTSLGAPSPITLGSIFCDTLAFALPILEDFLDLKTHNLVWSNA
jgi:hypothetical protein